jgi:putative transposase
MDRGFAGLKFLFFFRKYFVLRINQSFKMEFEEDSELIRVGTDEYSSLYIAVLNES